MMPSPLRCLKVLMAARASRKCLAFTAVKLERRGSSVNVNDASGKITVKVGVMDVSAFVVTVQVAVPEQPPPLQLEKAESLAGLLVRVTAVPSINSSVQAAPQLIPALEDVTIPLPMPALVTVRVKTREKVAVTVMSAFVVTVQVPVPEQPPPLQPMKTEPASRATPRVTEVPLSKDAEQVPPQSIPAGLLVTVPLPVPALVTVRVKVTTPVPVTALVAPAPPVKLRFPAKLPAEVGLKRTVTV